MQIAPWKYQPRKEKRAANFNGPHMVRTCNGDFDARGFQNHSLLMIQARGSTIMLCLFLYILMFQKSHVYNSSLCLNLRIVSWFVDFNRELMSIIAKSRRQCLNYCVKKSLFTFRLLKDFFRRTVIHTSRFWKGLCLKDAYCYFTFMRLPISNEPPNVCTSS